MSYSRIKASFCVLIPSFPIKDMANMVEPSHRSIEIPLHSGDEVSLFNF
jgi:hypothetical protein